jgi:hypothetical protein
MGTSGVTGGLSSGWDKRGIFNLGENRGGRMGIIIIHNIDIVRRGREAFMQVKIAVANWSQSGS